MSFAAAAQLTFWLCAGCGSPSPTVPEPHVPQWETERVWLPDFGIADFRGLGLSLTDSGNAAIAISLEGTLWVTRKTGRAFETPQRIDAGPPRHVRTPLLAATPWGMQVAVWQQRDATGQPRQLVWSNRFVPGESWDTPLLVDPQMPGKDGWGVSPEPDLAVTPSGAAAVVWAARDVFVSMAPDGRAWGPVETLDFRSERDVGYRVRVRAASDGRFVAAWSTRHDGRVAWGDPETGWTAPTVFPMPDGLTAGRAHLAANSTGRVLAVWSACCRDGERAWPILATAWSEGSGWSPLQELNEPGTRATAHAVGLDRSGRGFVLWSDPTPDYASAPAYAMARLSSRGDWSAPLAVPRASTFDPEGVGPDTYSTGAAILASGDVLLVWGDSRGTYPDYALREIRHDGAGWSEVRTLQDALPGLATNLSLTVNERGDAFAAWTRETAEAAVWASHWRGDASPLR